MTALAQNNFNTYFGNAGNGFYINWNVLQSEADAFDIATATLNMDVTWNLAGVAANSNTGSMFDAATAQYPIVFYMVMLDVAPSDATNPWDGVYGTLKVDLTNGTPDAMVIDWADSNPVQDVNCPDENCAT